MKKRLFAAILFLSLFTLTACSGVPNLSFNANWYRNTALKGSPGGTYEQLEYEVTFDSEADGDFSVEYVGGIYKTELKNDSVKLDEKEQEGYVFTTELNISVRFHLAGEQSELFTDTVKTRVEFLTPAEGLVPLSSERTVLSHVPVSENPSSLSESYREYNYSYSIDYDDALTRAKIRLTDLSSHQTVRENELGLEGKGTFLDNEQIAFALRGLDLTAYSRFRSINSVSERVQNVGIENLTEVKYQADFTADGQSVNREIDAYSLSLGYQGSDRGQSQTLIYAKTTDPAANTYRNVLLEMESPILHTLGTLRYRLKTAVFATK